MKRGTAIAVCLVVLIAGCSTGPAATDSTAPGTAAPTDTTTAEPTVTASPTASATSSPTASPTPTVSPTATATATPLPTQNPWRAETVTVGIDDTDAPDRNVTPLVREALDYWNGAGAKHATYPVAFELQPNATDPDIEVRFVEDIDTCGLHFLTTYVGCASILSADSRPDDPEVVHVLNDMTNESTADVITHEFGHVLGIEHGESPLGIMSSKRDVAYLPQPDARERVHPWESNNITVAYNLSDLPDYEVAQTRDELDNALEYYNDGADGFMPENATFHHVEDESDADILIEVRSGGEFKSSGQAYGISVDEDRALEYFTAYNIDLYDVDTDRVGWHAGYWLGVAMGVQTTDELPPPFDDPDDDNREDW